jgi:membrane protein required for colicin V production
MNRVDLILVVVLAVSFLWGFRKGLVATLASLIGLVLGVYCALNFSEFTAHYLNLWFSWSARSVSWISFIATFLAVVIGVSFLGKALTKLMGLIALGLFNKLLGGLIYTLQMMFLCSLCIWFLNAQNLLESKGIKTATEASRIYPFVADMAPNVWPKIKGFVQKANTEETDSHPGQQ